MSPARSLSWRWLALAPLALALGCFGQSASDSLPRDSAPTFFWGIQKRCKRDPYLSSAVEKRIFQMSSQTGGEVRRLLPGPTIENLPAESAAVEFRRACAGRRAQTAGLVLGGQVEERGSSPPYVLMRLWRLDLATQKLAFRDHYCRGCDIARTLATQAVFLLESPEPAADSQPLLPTFCDSAGPAAAPAPVDSDRILLSLQGGDKATRSSVFEAVKREQALIGRELLPVETQRQAAAPGALSEAAQRLLGLAIGRGAAKIRANRALAIDLAEGGGAELALASRSGSQPPAVAISCARCSAETLAQRVARAAARLLDESVEDSTSLASPGTVEAPLLPAVRAALCGAAGAGAARGCATAGGTRLDSDPSLTPFYDPPCGELVEGTAPPSR